MLLSMMAEEPKIAGPLLRVVARTIDLIIILAVAESLPRSGWLAGIGYVLIGDGLMGGMSIGKKLTGISVISVEGKAASIKDSIIRNMTLGLALLLWRIPFVGWIAGGLVAGFEFVLMIGSKEGRRLGDEIAKTLVVQRQTPEQEIKEK